MSRERIQKSLFLNHRRKEITMKKRNFTGLLITGALLLSTISTTAFAEAIIYDQKADPIIFNKHVTRLHIYV